MAIARIFAGYMIDRKTGNTGRTSGLYVPLIVFPGFFNNQKEKETLSGPLYDPSLVLCAVVRLSRTALPEET